jgi:hypothetical protein
MSHLQRPTIAYLQLPCSESIHTRVGEHCRCCPCCVGEPDLERSGLDEPDCVEQYFGSQTVSQRPSNVIALTVANECLPVRCPDGLGARTACRVLPDGFERCIAEQCRLHDAGRCREWPAAAATARQRRHDKLGNEQSGPSGTIRVTKTSHEAAMLCHTVTTIPMAKPPANRIVLNWCKTRGGEWKMPS